MHSDRKSTVLVIFLTKITKCGTTTASRGTFVHVHSVCPVSFPLTGITHTTISLYYSKMPSYTITVNLDRRPYSTLNGGIDVRGPLCPKLQSPNSLLSRHPQSRHHKREAKGLHKKQIQKETYWKGALLFFLSTVDRHKNQRSGDHIHFSILHDNQYKHNKIPQNVKRS